MQCSFVNEDILYFSLFGDNKKINYYYYFSVRNGKTKLGINSYFDVQLILPTNRYYLYILCSFTVFWKVPTSSKKFTPSEQPKGYKSRKY